LGGTLTLSASSGLATFSGLSLTKAGSGYTIAVSDSGLTPATSSAISVAPGTATQLIVVGQPPTQTMVGSTFAVTIEAEDAYNNVATGFTGSVALSLANLPASTTILSGTTTVTAANGVATFTGLAINDLGSNYKLVANSAGTTSATTSPIVALGSETPTFNGTADGGVVGRTDSGAIWVGNFTDGELVTTYFGAWSTVVDWEYVVQGDFTGNGKQDIAGMTSTGQWWVAINNGSSFTSTLWTNWSTAVTWQDITVGDFTGNGKDDIVARTSSGQWWVAESTGTSFTNQYFGAWSNSAWTNVVVGDFTGSGVDDVAGYQDGQWWVGVPTNGQFAWSVWTYWVSTVDWQFVQVGDFTGSGRDDIIGRDPGTGAWWVSASTGTSFTNELFGFWSTAVQWTNVMAADFTGDGIDDIAGMANGANWWVGTSTGSSFTENFWVAWDSTISWLDVQVTDVNGDGKADIIGREPNGVWWAAQSTGSSFTNVDEGAWYEAAGWNNVLARQPTASNTADNLPLTGVTPGQITIDLLQYLSGTTAPAISSALTALKTQAAPYDNLTSLISDVNTSETDLTSLVNLIKPLEQGSVSSVQLGPGMWLDAHQLDLLDRTIYWAVEQASSGNGSPTYDAGVAPTTSAAFQTMLGQVFGSTTVSAWTSTVDIAFQYAIDSGGLSGAAAAFFGETAGAETMLLSATDLGLVALKTSTKSGAQTAQTLVASPILAQQISASDQLGTQAMTQATTADTAATDVKKFQTDLEAWDTALVNNFGSL
jgi:hypothetical protein